MSRIIFFICIYCCFNSLLYSQQKTVSDNQVATVFYIGEDEKNYEKLVEEYSSLLFTVCNNNMESAFDKWTILLKDLEDFASESHLDLKGVKLWMNVFWDKDGTIDHIVFYPKPNSKNLNYDQVKSVLINFVKVYQSPIKYSTKFSHYGSAAFPVFSRAVRGNEK